MSSAAIDPPRNVERCTLCGYPLTGLPDAGRCPECGQAYDQSQIILSGWDTGSLRQDPSGPLGWRAGINIIAPGTILAVVLFAQFRRSPYGLAWLALIPVICSVSGIVLLRQQHDPIPPILLYMDQQGWFTGKHPGTKETRFFHTIICMIGFGLPYLLLVAQSNRSFFVVTIIFWLLGIGGACIAKIRNSRRHRPPSPNGQPDDASRPVLWQANSRLSFRQIRSTHWRLSVEEDKTWKERSFRITRPPKSFTLDLYLTQARLDHLAAQIATWPVELEIIRQQPPA